jgi:hypothetical protein
MITSAAGSAFTKEQLYSTASYQAKDLHSLKLGSSRRPADV